MKNKRILPIVALAAISLLLASCTISVTPAPAPVRDFTFQSSWRVNNTNQWVACENQQTIFEYTFHADNPAMVQSITEHYEGVVTGEKKTATVNGGWDVSGHRVSEQAVFHAGGGYLPLANGTELGSQAIVVVPVEPNPDKRGATRFWIEVEYGGSVPISYRSPVTTVDIYANCTAS